MPHVIYRSSELASGFASRLWVNNINTTVHKIINPSRDHLHNMDLLLFNLITSYCVHFKLVVLRK